MRNRHLLCCLLLGASVAGLASPAHAQRVDRIVAFGDSYADFGITRQTILADPAANPLLQAFVLNFYPNGRFSDGTNYVDTLSDILNAPAESYAAGGAFTRTFAGVANNTNCFASPATCPLGLSYEVDQFLNVGTQSPLFPTSGPTFDADDLLTVSIGGNDARFFQQSGGLLSDAPAAAQLSVTAAATQLDRLVAAGAPTISFLAGDTSRLPEIAADANAQAIRAAYSGQFNSGMQSVLAGYAADGVMVHYLDLNLMLDNIIADPAAYGITNGLVCPAFPADTTCFFNSSGYLFYGDGLHLTSGGFAIVGRYVAAQLQAPLTMAGTSELGLDTARQFGRTLTSRVELSAPRDGDLAEGTQLFIVGDTFSRDVEQTDPTDAFDTDGVGVTAGASFGFGNSLIGIAGNYSRPKARFAGGTASTRSSSWQVGGFAGFGYFGGFAQAYLGYGQDSHDISRTGVIDDMTADADGSHWLAGAKAGYLLPLGIMRVGPVAALDYAKAKVDGYTEEGDAALTLNVDSVSAKSLTGSLGLELRGDFDNAGIQLRPFAAAAVEKELSGSGDTVRFSQTSAPGIVNSWSFADRSKKAYGRISGGASAAILNSATLDAALSSTIGKQEGDEVSAQVGLRLGF